MNNMEPEKKCPCACHLNVLNKPYEHDTKCCDDMNGFIPEKKDWEGGFDKEFSHVGWIPENKAHIKDFIRQNFISRAEVVEKIESLDLKVIEVTEAEDKGEWVLKIKHKDLLDLLTQ